MFHGRRGLLDSSPGLSHNFIMAKTTDTRDLVREAAQQLAGRGVEPTPTLVRNLLGKGSPNVIVDELRKWRAEQPPGGLPPRRAEVLRQAGQAELADQMLQVARLAEELRGMRGALSTWAEQSSALMDELRTERAASRDRLRTLGERFESMQRYALLAIESAREETRRYKDLAQERVTELANWRQIAQDAMRRAVPRWQDSTRDGGP